MMIKNLYSYSDIIDDKYDLVFDPRRAIIDCLKYCYCNGLICRDDCVELMLQVELAYNNHELNGPLSYKDLLFYYKMFYGE